MNVLLATAWVTVTVASGRAVSVCALLDQGSEMTFITESLVQALRARKFNMPVEISAVGEVNAGTYRYATTINVSQRGRVTPAYSTTALILKSLTAYCPKRLPADVSLAHLADLQWADSDPMSSDPISLIIGTDIYSEHDETIKEFQVSQ